MTDGLQIVICYIDLSEKSAYWNSIGENLGDAFGTISREKHFPHFKK